ncbi:hypothetical protein B7H23_00800 [Notoacmeibacter marinus]|uniref:DUF2975 domain-containing protein n=1 Tax=Notoacmeibacter marinus TaxID=1876515 RepID=A0A231V0A1_9HYPH|nr:DUF2975 domain-containing protein [Notoacmeibacter marinus]OXT01550.1 hypothetical protein B7H23_00800 [Notoacmeibacter marinus]
MERNIRRQRIVLWSRALNLLLTAMAVVAPLAVVVMGATMSAAEIAASADVDPALFPTVTDDKRIAIVVLTVIPVLVLSYGLLRLRTALSAFRRGQYFSRDVFVAFRSFASTLLAATLLRLAVVPLTGLILSAGSEKGSLAITIGFDTIQSLVLIAGFWLLAWVFTEAAAIEDENRQFV